MSQSGGLVFSGPRRDKLFLLEEVSDVMSHFAAASRLEACPSISRFYRQEHEAGWTLEVVDHEGASTVLTINLKPIRQRSMPECKSLKTRASVPLSRIDRAGCTKRLIAGGQEPPDRLQILRMR